MSADLNSLLAPNDDKQFEQLCQHVLEHRFKTLWGQAYGRNGQAQHGVDFYIEVPASIGAGGSGANQIIGVQCKHKDRLVEGELGVKELEDEVKKAKGFKPALTTFIVATSAPTDTKPQDKARELTAEHQKQNPPLFSVEVLFWEKIRDEFSKNGELWREIRERFYPHFVLAQPAQHSVLHQLPTKPAHFTGRDEELAELENELASAHVVGATISGVRTKLHGAPGVGKTALTTVLAHKLKDRYPDAQLYLNLRGAGADIHGQQSTAVKPMTPAEAMQSIIHAFHPEEKLPEELDKLSVKYYGVLNDAGRVLLFLDNAADAAQVKPLLPPDNCLLLVTSRAQFSLPGLAVRNIDCLRPEMSQQLLRDLSPRIEGCENEAAELCGHLPLALKVFAGVVNDKKLYPVPDLLKRLREGLAKLAPVDAAFQVSYDLLADDLRRRWVLLAVFPASFDLPAAAAVWATVAAVYVRRDDNESDDSAVIDRRYNEAREAMQALVNASLVEWNEAGGRFRLHDLVRQFCNGKLTEAERTELHLAHARHYTAIGEEADELYKTKGKHADGLALFDREREQIEAAYSWLDGQVGRVTPCAPDSAKTASQRRTEDCPPYPPITLEADARQMIALVDAVVYTGDLRFHPRQRIAWLESQLRAARIVEDREAEGTALGNLGIAHFSLGDARKAIELYEQRLIIAREIGDRRGEGNALGNIGIAHANLGDARKAIEFFEQHQANAREIGDRRGEGNALMNQGNVQFSLGDARSAIEFHQQALTLFRKIGERRGEGNALGNLGNAHSSLGDARKAIEFYEQAVVIRREVGDRRGEGNDLWNSADEFMEMGNRAEAIPCAEAALKIFEAIEDPFAVQGRAKLAEWRAAKP